MENQMDKNIQQAMFPGSSAWFLEKKPVRILHVISIIATVAFLAFSVIALVTGLIDSLTGTQALIILAYLPVWLIVTLIANNRVSNDKAVYIKENGHMFRVIPTPNSGTGAMVGGIAGGLIGAAIGSAIDSAADKSDTLGTGVLGMAHKRIGMVFQITGVSQIEEKDDLYCVAATLILHQPNNKTSKPKEKKFIIDKRTLAVDGLMAELRAFQ